MTLSIIIVNYNVRHFLEQAVSSALSALKGLSGEIIVVDNASVDDSVEMMQNMFPHVQLIQSKTNLGFSKANNIGIHAATGKYILLLNPDTLVPENCFKTCIDFIEKNNDVGALGVKMLDGSGKMLPESKRGFPSPWVSFCKMLGLHYVFPHSKLFNYYYLGHLDSNQNQEIDILTGAFFLVRRSILDEIGLLDESFFMYGEDVDLSYRVQKSGHKIYYLADTQIIHYKGESTKKVSLNYVSTFYNAMIIFAKKHFSGSKKSGTIMFLKFAIMLKGLLALIKTWFRAFSFIIIDSLAILTGVYLAKRFWSIWYFQTEYYYPSPIIWFNAVLYTCIWIFAFFIQGVYETKFKTASLLLSTIFGLFINLVIYSLLPEHYRASRMILLLSFLWTLIYAILSRMVYNKIAWNRWVIGVDKRKQIVVIGSPSTAEKVSLILNASKIEHQISKIISPTQITSDPNYWKELVAVYQVDQIIFGSPNELQDTFGLSMNQVLSFINLIPAPVEFKMITESGQGIIGSPSKNNPGELYTFEVQYNLLQKIYLRQKRIFDLFFSLSVFIFSWLIILIQHNKLKFLSNLYEVIIGKKTWVGYSKEIAEKYQLPIIKTGIIIPNIDKMEHQLEELNEPMIRNYAWNYSVWMDLDICLKAINQLDQ